MQNKNKGEMGGFSWLISFAIIALLIPLLLNLAVPKTSNNAPTVDEPAVEEIVLDTTGFVDYAFPNKREYLSTSNYEKYNLNRKIGAMHAYEITQPDGNQYIEYSDGYANDYAEYFDSKIGNDTTQDCNGILVSFDIANDYSNLFVRFSLIIRDLDNNPNGSFSNFTVPTVKGKWQHVVLNYNFRENTCDVYIDGQKQTYNSVFESYDSTYTYTISAFRFLTDQYSDSQNYDRTYIDNFAMNSYNDFNEELINEFETNSGELLDVPVAYVDGVPHYNYTTLKEALTGDTRKDVVIVAPYEFYNSPIVISCPVRIKNNSPMVLTCSAAIECIGEKDGIWFYDYKKTE